NAKRSTPNIERRTLKVVCRVQRVGPDLRAGRYDVRTGQTSIRPDRLARKAIQRLSAQPACSLSTTVHCLRAWGPLLDALEFFHVAHARRAAAIISREPAQACPGARSDA